MYCVVDIETTGGSATNSRITEIGIVKTDGNRVIDRFQSLVNPQQDIPRNIIQLTGIFPEMVKDAPRFDEILERVNEFTSDCIFVAHNVNFDYRFIQAEFKRYGQQFKRKKVCTVRLSRKIIPGKASYSLGKLCESEGIEIKGRHRAMGDAEATTTLLHKLIKLDGTKNIDLFLNPLSLEALIPPNLQKADFLALPEKQGIYYFLNQQKEIIYIGKAKNLKKRVHSHLSGSTNTGSKSYFNNHLFGIDFKVIEHDLLTNLIEAKEIKKHWPQYNRSLKRFSLNYGIFKYVDRNGYQRFNIGRCGKNDKPLLAFQNREQVHHVISELVKMYQLCPRLSGLQPIGSGKCNYILENDCEGACCGEETAETYNLKMNNAIQDAMIQGETYLIRDPLKDEAKDAIVLVEKGRYKGYGTIDKSTKINSLNAAKSFLSSAYDDQDMLGMVKSYLEKSPIDSILYFHEFSSNPA